MHSSIDAGNSNWPVIRDHVDEIVLVSDAEIISTMKLMWERMKLVCCTTPQPTTYQHSVLTYSCEPPVCTFWHRS